MIQEVDFMRSTYRKSQSARLNLPAGAVAVKENANQVVNHCTQEHTSEKE